MKYISVLFMLFVVSGCQSLMKDIFEIAATPDELSKMTAIDVCKQFGLSQWRNQPQAYLDAKAEVKKRITAQEVVSEDCAQFAQMAIREKEAARVQMYKAENIRKEMESQTQQTTTRCRDNGISIRCTSQSY